MTKPKYFSITYDMSKLTKDEQQAVFKEAMKVMDDERKLVIAGWGTSWPNQDNDSVGWTSIYDDLPSEDGLYLTYNKDDGINIEQFYTNLGVFEYSNPSHWHLLPISPTG